MLEKGKAFLKNKNNLIIIVLFGVLFMVAALPVDNKKQTGDNKTQSNRTEESGGFNETYNEEKTDTVDYVSELESKLEVLLSEMEGAGKVKVLITLRSSVEKVVEKDMPLTRSNTSEQDAEGGTRQVNNVDSGESTVYIKEGNGETPYVVKTISPRVEGVLVLAEGAGSGSVSKNIADAIQAIFDIEAHKIMVVKMKQ